MIALLSIVFNLIRSEPLVLYPSIIISFVTTWLLQLLKINIQDITLTNNVFIYLISSGLLQIFNQLLVTDLGKSLLKEKTIAFGRSLKTTLLRFVPALLSINLILISMTLIIYFSRHNLITSLLALPLILILAIVFQLFPLFYVISDKQVVRIFQVIYHFFTQKFRLAVFLIFFALFIFTFTFLIISLFEGLSANLRSILIPIVQGTANTFLIYTVIILYYNQLALHVNTKA